MLTKICTEKVPTYALCYIINGDASGLEDYDIKLIDEFMNSYHGATFDVTEENLDHPYFTGYPAFGLATEVVDMDIYMNE